MTDGAQPHTDGEELLRCLNQHGYGFQYRVLRACNKAPVYKTISWRLQAAEYPISHSGQDLHVDGILELSQTINNVHRFCVVECKRSHEGRWGFAKSFTGPDEPLVDCFARAPGNMGAEVHIFSPGAPCTQVAIDMREERQQRRNLAHAINQVLLGAAGVATELTREETPAYVFPLVVTNARLFLARQPLDMAQFPDGTILGAVDEVPWLWLEVALSRSMRVDVYRTEPRAGITSNRFLMSEVGAHRRAVAIASLDGLQEALRVMGSLLPERVVNVESRF